MPEVGAYNPVATQDQWKGNSMTKLTPQRGLWVFISNGRLPFWGMLALVCLLALTSQPVRAQVAFGSIVGNVTDASGGGMSGASVKITLIQTNDSRSVLTNDAGGYTLTTVIPGTYRVEVTRPRFRTFAASDSLRGSDANFGAGILIG